MSEDIKTLLDICELNTLRNANDNSILSADEKKSNKTAIDRKLRDKMMALPKLEIDKEKVDKVNKLWGTYLGENEVIVT